MPSLQQLRRRIVSVNSTRHITRAMQLVSASKLKRVERQLDGAQALLAFQEELIHRVRVSSPALTHPFWERREVDQTAVIVLGSDAGLCGSYNQQLLAFALATLRQMPRERTTLVVVGKRAIAPLRKAGWPADVACVGWAGRPRGAYLDSLVEAVVPPFLDGRTGRVVAVAMERHSGLLCRPVLTTVLPAAAPEPQVQGPWTVPYLFEPSAGAVVEALLAEWIRRRLWVLLLEAFAAEHGTRMIAMKNATDNAEEMVGQLTRWRNKVRQATITRELADITGTAEALT